MNTNELAEILLVEDNPDDEELTRFAFRTCGIQNPIHVAHDGVEALEYLLNGDTLGHRQLPRLMLLDLKLPKVSGLEVLKQLRGNTLTYGLPIIILTTSSQEEDITESYRLGANSFLRKPVEFQKFTEMVKNIGAYWLQMNLVPLA